MKKIFVNCRVEVEKCTLCERYEECKKKSRKMIATISKKENILKKFKAESKSKVSQVTRWLSEKQKQLKKWFSNDDNQDKIMTAIVIAIIVFIIWMFLISKLSNNVSAQNVKVSEDSILLCEEENNIVESNDNIEESEVVEEVETVEVSEIAVEPVKTKETEKTVDFDESKITDENVISDITETENTIPTVKSEPAISSNGPSEQYYYHVSNADKMLIARVVFAEAGAECFEGKVAVAAVVLNRYFHGDGMGFDRRSIHSVITQKSQFADISLVTSSKIAEAPSCMEAVEAACKGWDPTRKVFEKGAMFFFNPDRLSERAAKAREGIKTMRIENHLFHYDFSKS